MPALGRRDREPSSPPSYSAVAFVRLADGTPAVAKLPPPNDDERARGSRPSPPGPARGGAAARPVTRRRPAARAGRARRPRRPTTRRSRRRCLACGSSRRRRCRWQTADELAPRWSATVARWRDRIGRRLADAAVAASTPGSRPGRGGSSTATATTATSSTAAPAGWLAIDPQPLVGPPALDLAPALWNGPEAPVGDRIAVLAATAGVDAERARPPRPDPGRAQRGVDLRRRRADGEWAARASRRRPRPRADRA